MNGLAKEQIPIALPPRMKLALERYRKRVWFVKIAEAVLAAIFGLLVSYLTVFFLDRLFDTPAPLRTCILLLGCFGPVFLLPLKIHNWVWRRRRFDQVARLIQRTYPRFGDHLLGIVELTEGGSMEGQSRRLVEAAIRQVDGELEHRDLSKAVPSPTHWRWAWAAGAPLVMVVGLMLVIPAAGRNSLARWAMPWKHLDRYTFTQLKPLPAVQIVPYAEPFQVDSTLNENSPWNPDSASARYGDQEPLIAEREGATYQFGVPPQTKAADFSLRIGDARHDIPVEPKMRPALVHLTAEITLPDYLERNEPMVLDARGGTINPVRGSAVAFRAGATRELAAATLDSRLQRVDGNNLFTESIPVHDSVELNLTWRDQFGLTPREPQLLRIDPQEDAPPAVTFNQLKNNQVLLSTELLAFEIQAGDDFGVKRVGLRWEGINDPVHNPEPAGGERIVAPGTPEEDTMIVTATFSSEREGVDPQSLRLRAFAEDYFPGRERVHSPSLVVHVLSPSDHFKWLTEQLSNWASASQEVYEKEVQLNEKNKELMALPSGSLEAPATRKEIQVQAAAETANAEKLELVINAGKEIVKHATRNEEFGAAQLESLAMMIQELEAIAGEQMPDVAELLQLAAAAPGSMPAISPEKEFPGDPGETLDPKQPNEQEPEGPIASPTGGKELGLAEADGDGPDNITPEGLDEAPEEPNSHGGGVAVHHAKPAGGKPGYIPANPTPLVADHESGFNESEKAADAPRIKSGSSIPATVMKGSGRPPEEEDETPPDSTADLVLKALTEQQDLLTAFAKLASEMNRLLMGFENSTFVKRLKAASRNQIDLAVDLNNLDGFGIDEDVLADQPARDSLASLQLAESESLFLIQEDMMAYAERKPSDKFTRTLEEMENQAVVDEIRNISAAIEQNEVGQSTIDAEFWADTLDRFAEQLVDPLPPPGDPPPSELIELPNLTPEIVLEVIRIIHQEIELREETRELHQTVAALSEEEYKERGNELSQTQAELSEKTLDIIEETAKLPKASHPHIQNQITKLSDAKTVMNEVEELLVKPETGPPTVAAISEVIEILLETARAPNTPVVAKAPPASAPALMLIGIGDDGNRVFIENRAPSQAIGNTGRKLPEEYRQGLDAYLNALESR